MGKEKPPPPYETPPDVGGPLTTMEEESTIQLNENITNQQDSALDLNKEPNVTSQIATLDLNEPLPKELPNSIDVEMQQSHSQDIGTTSRLQKAQDNHWDCQLVEHHHHDHE